MESNCSRKPNVPHAVVAASGEGTVLDSSGNGHNGTPINGPVYRSSVGASVIPLTGAVNQRSMSFNGVDQRVFIPDSPDFQLTQSLTLEAYVNIAQPANNLFGERQIVFRGDDQIGLDPYQLRVLSSTICFDITGADGNRIEVSAPLPPLNTWVHVAGVLDGASGKMTLYLNGQAKASITTKSRPLGPLTGANPGIGIGDVESGTFDEHYQGLIDEVRISSAALQPSQFLDAAAQNASISGQVFNDQNANAARDAGEPGMAGVKVFLDSNANGKLDAGEPTQVSDASGNYTFSGLAAGSYRVREVVPTGYALTAPAAKSYSMTIASGAHSTGKNFGNAHAVASISGRVFGDSNGNGLLDHGEVGMGLWKIFLDTNNDGVLESGEQSTTTDILGNWSFKGLIKGTYHVRIVPVSGLTATTSKVLTITVGDAQQITGKLFGEQAD